MAGSPKWKVYRDGKYVAACKHIEDAAVLVAAAPTGSEIRYEHSFVVWREGHESQPAGASYDFVHETVQARVLERHRNNYARVYGAN